VVPQALPDASQNIVFQLEDIANPHVCAQKGYNPACQLLEIFVWGNNGGIQVFTVLLETANQAAEWEKVTADLHGQAVGMLVDQDKRFLCHADDGVLHGCLLRRWLLLQCTIVCSEWWGRSTHSHPAVCLLLM